MKQQPFSLQCLAAASIASLAWFYREGEQDASIFTMFLAPGTVPRAGDNQARRAKAKFEKWLPHCITNQIFAHRFICLSSVDQFNHSRNCNNQCDICVRRQFSSFPRLL